MKKIFVLAAVAALTTAVSCEKIEQGSIKTGDNYSPELAIMNVANITKGYVEGSEFIDTPFDKLHPSTDKEYREMMVSAYLTPQNGEPGNYFKGEKFARESSDELWHHTPKVYWPLAGTLDFLAYSIKDKTLLDTQVKWAENAASKVTLDIPNDFTQDDILYSGVTGGKYNTAGAGSGNVAMKFGHAQAWLEFQLKVVDASMDNIIHINSITIENVYNRGELNITRDASVAEVGATAKWNFRKETSANILMDDTYNVTAAGNFLRSEVQYMDMLLPEQAKTSFVIEYTLEGQPNVLTYRYDITGSANSNWLMGNKYIYVVNISLYEITITPSVVPFVDGDVSDFDPIDLA